MNRIKTISMLFILVSLCKKKIINALHSTTIRPFCHNGKITVCHQAFQSVEHSCTDLVTPGEAAVMAQPDEALGTVQSD